MENRQKQLVAQKNKQRYLNKLKREAQQKLDKRKGSADLPDENGSGLSTAKTKQEEILAAVNRVKEKRKARDN
jgi:hypothetical protein